MVICNVRPASDTTNSQSKSRTQKMITSADKNNKKAADKKKEKALGEAVAEDKGNDSFNASRSDSGSCPCCGGQVLDSQPALKCDGCSYWHHAACEKTSDEVYDFLCEHSNETSLLWYCRKCVVTNKRTMVMLMTLNDHQQQLEAKVSELADTMNRKMEDLTKMVNKNMDNTEAKIDKVIVQDTQKRVEEKVDKLVQSLEQQRKTDSHFVLNCVEDALGIKLQEDREEAEEVNKRRNCIIMHGLKESTEADYEGRMKNDEEEIINLLHDIKCDDVSVKSTVRLGRKDGTEGAKPRPVKVTLASEGQKNKVLSHAKNLRHTKQKDLEKVYIHQDLTPRQRQQRAVLVQEMKRRQAEGETNLILVNGKIVERKDSEHPRTSD